jgi:heme-degrading monooxygenase HmoA
MALRIQILKPIIMVARNWHGKTNMSNYASYTEFLKQKAVPDYQKTRGFKGLSFLRKMADNEGHFILITYWEDHEAIKNFAGQDIEKAKYYPEDKHFLLELEEKVQHYEVFA